ncbi:hypothetical protein KJ612_12820, partial [Myxococcota bacterium]|nr:hypothetical protein [Myxococcota bacterium]
MKIVLPFLMFLLISPCSFAQTPEAPAKTTAVSLTPVEEPALVAPSAQPESQPVAVVTPAPAVAVVSAPFPKAPPILTVSISPIHLALPVGEVMAEYNLNNKFGLAGIVGFGSVTVEDALGNDVTGDVFEFGAQANFYALGCFRKGLHVGVEAMYLNAKMEQNSVKATGEGLSLGGYVGYKHTFSFG